MNEDKESVVNPGAEDIRPDVSVWPTPNPNALKFMLDIPLKNSGKATYRSPETAEHIPLAKEIFLLGRIESLHFFQNSLTVTKLPEEDWDPLEMNIIECLEKKAPLHNPDFQEPDPEEERRKNLSPEILEIEEVLDRTIRPGLQADGGDIICVDFKDNVLLVRYQGACGTCPSSASGTLEAIRSILTHELKREIDVYIVPE